MPLSAFVALFLAFGFNATAEASTEVPTRAELLIAVAKVFGAVFLVGAFAFGFGRLVAWLAARHDEISPRLRRIYYLGARLVGLLNLVVYGEIIHDLGWAGLVRRAIGESIFIDDVLIFLPFPIMQILGWWGLHAAERAIRWRGPKTPGRYVWLKARSTFGMVLPVAAVYAIGADLLRYFRPEFESSPWEKPISLALIGAFVLAIAPLLIRIAWPMRSLPTGPLRDRLEHLGRRLNFRCTDILVWDTDGMVINAAVTGSLPWFRYVLLTDALIDCLNPAEVSAVFGHEIGHVAHRHLVFFGLFILGSLGVYALFDSGISSLMVQMPRPTWLAPESMASIALEISAALLAVGGYFWLVFGHLSRRFERQADVFGCRAVSCGQPECPPHYDLDDLPVPDDFPKSDFPQRSDALCPIGIRIFVSALANVAELNDMKLGAWSWRHGSIRRRIAFLESLANQPEAERSFQKGVSRMRKGLAVVLAAAILLAFWNDLFR